MIAIMIFYLFVRLTQSNEECGIWKNENSPPWIVGVYIENEEQMDLVCFGTIFKPNFVVTAAHCVCENSSNVVQGNAIYVTSGSLQEQYVKYNQSYDRGLQMVKKENILINKVYKGSLNTKGDIAILKLDRALSEIPICVDWDNNINLQNGYWLKYPSWRQNEVEMVDVSFLDFPLCLYAASESFAKSITPDKVCVQSRSETSIDDIDRGAGLIYLNFVDNLWYIRGIVTSRDVEKKLVTCSNVNVFLNWLSAISVKL